MEGAGWRGPAGCGPGKAPGWRDPTGGGGEGSPGGEPHASEGHGWPQRARQRDADTPPVASPVVADTAVALRELRAARRRKRVANIEWFEALYRVYLTGIVGIVIVLLISSW